MQGKIIRLGILTTLVFSSQLFSETLSKTCHPFNWPDTGKTGLLRSNPYHPNFFDERKSNYSINGRQISWKSRDLKHSHKNSYQSQFVVGSEQPESKALSKKMLSSHFSLDSVSIPTNLKFISKKAGNLLLYSGTISYNVTNPKGLKLYANLRFNVHSARAYSSSTGSYALSLTTKIQANNNPSVIVQDFQVLVSAYVLPDQILATLTLSDSTEVLMPKGNLRLPEATAFYLGDSFIQLGFWPATAESLLIEKKGGSILQYALYGGETDPVYSRVIARKKSRWTPPGGVGGPTCNAIGWSGATIQRMVDNPQHWVSRLAEIQPSIAIIELGLNDALYMLDSLRKKGDSSDWGENVRNSVSQLAKLIQAQGTFPIFMTPTAADENKKFGSTDLSGMNTLILKVASFIEAETKDLGIPCISLTQANMDAQKNDLDLRPYDGIHPTAKGHHWLGVRVAEALKFNETWRSPY